MAKKLLDFQANISDVKQINPLFSTCKVRVLYTGKNRNMSIITKDAVEKALPTLKNIPIVGEFSEPLGDYKGHGGAIDLDSYKYIHTTKPYGVVPESATYEWEEVRGREYLTISGCYLWTGRYEEAYSVIEKGKGQSMEIEVSDGKWVEEEDAYRIDSFTFSALCILGDDVEPAFEDANITAYSFDKDSFKKEFSTMLDELKESLSQKKEGNTVLKELLKKYSLTVEDLTAKGINFNEVSEDDLEAKIIEAFEIVENPEDKPEDKQNPEDKPNPDDKPEDKPEDVDFEAKVKDLEADLVSANEQISTLKTEVESLREFKLNTEKAEHKASADGLFSKFQLSEDDVAGLDIHAFSLDEIEEKCYAIIGKKLASNKNFSKGNGKENIKLNLGGKKDDEDNKSVYGGLFE